MELRAATEQDLLEVAKTSISRGPKELPNVIDYVYAIDDHGTILAVGGMKLMTPTTAWVWMNLSAKARDKMILIYRVIKTWLPAWFEGKGLERIMAAVACDFEEGILVAEHLGFHRESTMKRFFGDGDAYLYVLLKDDA
jgi:hypothetical protein